MKPAPGTKVQYTLDGTTPTDSSSLYDKPITVELNDGEVKTLKAVVVNAAGRKSVVYSATIVRGAMREPDKTDAGKPGVTYDAVVPNTDPGTYKGETRSILLTQFERTFDLKKPFGVQFDGYLRIPADGVYELQVDSTWDTTVVLGDKGMIINDAGTKERKERSAVVPLKTGLHKISLRYNHRGGDVLPHFRFRYGIKGQGLRQAGGGDFVH